MKQEWQPRPRDAARVRVHALLHMERNPKAHLRPRQAPGPSCPAISPRLPTKPSLSAPAQSRPPAAARCPAHSCVPLHYRREPCEIKVEFRVEGRWVWPPATIRSARRWASGPSVDAPGRRSPRRRRRHRRLGDAGRASPRPRLRNTGRCREPKPRPQRDLETKHGAKVPAQAGEIRGVSFGSTGAWGHPSHPPPTHPTQPNTLTAPRASRRSSGVAWTWPAFQATFPDSRCPGRGGRDWQLGKLPEGSYWGGHGACDERKRRRRGGGGRLRGRLGKEG